MCRTPPCLVYRLAGDCQEIDEEEEEKEEEEKEEEEEEKEEWISAISSVVFTWLLSMAPCHIYSSSVVPAL